MVKAILFDLGQVVVTFDLQVALKQVMDVSAVSQAEVKAFFSFSAPDVLFTEGKMTGKDFYESAKNQLKLTIDYVTFQRMYNDIFMANPIMDELIIALRERYQLAILSNTNAFHFPYIMETFPIMNIFDDYIVSYEEQCQKPNPEIFHRALGRMGMRPEEVVFVDDTEENVISAQQIGIKSIHFTTPQDMVVAMRLCGVAI